VSAPRQFVPEMASIAREAGALLMRHFGKVEIEYKGDVDLVTRADREAEALITKRIHSAWPTHDLVGEEGASRESGSDYRWYVDPLDGTTNFAHHFPVFCVSLGLEHKGKLVAGVCYDPTRDELFATEEGSGAFLNDKPMHVSKITRLAESLVATGFPSHKRHKNPNIHFYHQLTLRSHGVRRAGSAALDLCYVAAGRYDGYWEFNLNAWDVSAGILLVQEAGGRVTDMRGQACDHRSPKEILASNGLIHTEMLGEMKAIFEGRVEGLPSPKDHATARKL
jgi:myo-inositol-1(or 4)-monophosphatase